MNKDEMKDIMARDAGLEDAWVHRPMEMEPEDAATWLALTFEAVGRFALHMSEHMESERYVEMEDEDGERFQDRPWMAAAGELKDLIMMVHNCVDVMTRCVTPEELAETIKMHLERQMGIPIAGLQRIGSGLLIVTGDMDLPDSLEGMDGDGNEEERG